MPRMILVVDDDAINRKLLTKILSAEYTVMEAEDGAEALNILRRRNRTFSAIILDLIMPKTDGFQVLKQLSQSPFLSQIPVIVASASTDGDAEIKALSEGATDFITKPYRPAVILSRLRNLIRLKETASIISSLQRDKLTGLYNREAFFSAIANRIAAQPAGHYIAACFDIDGFKIINDQYGSEKGDAILRDIAKVFESGLSKVDGVCGRISGDKFALLYPAEFASSPALEAIRREASVLDGSIAPLELSVGRYVVDDLTLPVSAMYDRAAIARASVKGRYDRHIAYYDTAMRQSLLKEQAIVNEMKAALQSGQFEAWYQPQYNHATGAMIGAEALVRWRHPKRGLIPPGEFIPVFERNGFVYELDKAVWEQVCAQLRQWLNEGRRPLPVSVNISRYDLFRDDLVDVIIELVRRYDLYADLLRLEITESAFAQSAQRVVEVVNQFVANGFTIEIDDFGSGYSSLNTLKDVPAQILKLDMRFLEGTNNLDRGGSILESIVRMARWIDTAVIAEGVETLQQADYLKSIGCNYVQGYLYARPMPAAEYAALAADAKAEERLAAMETVENLDNASFWNPKSMDTLIFNSYVGAACIFEYHNGKIELLRASSKYRQLFANANIDIEKALKLDWAAHMDANNLKTAENAIRRSIEIRQDVPCELIFTDLPKCPKEVYLRFLLRVIASAGERYLVYATYENLTEQRKAERLLVRNDKQLRFLNDVSHDLLALPEEETGIKRVLSKILHYYSAQRVSLFEVDPQTHTSVIAYQVCAPKTTGNAAALTGTPEKLFSAWFKQFDQNKLVHLADVSALPKSRTKERLALMAQGIKALIAVPFFRGGGLAGFITLDNPASHQEQAQQLQTLGDYMTVMLNHRDLLRRIDVDQNALNSLMNDTPGGFARMRVLPNGTLSTVYVNEPLCRLRGMTAEAIIAADNENALVAVHPDDVSMIKTVVQRILKTGERCSVVYRLRRADGAYIPLNAHARITKSETGETFMNLFYTELSDGEQKAADVRETMPFILSAIMKSTTDMAYAKDKSYRYLCCSAAFARFAGQEDENGVIGKTDFELFPQATAKQFRADDERLFKSGRSIVNYIEPIPSDDEAQHYAKTSKYILRDSTGEILGLYGYGQDVTDTRNAFEQLKLLNDSIPGGIASYALSPREMRITYFNDGFCKMLGYTRQQYKALSQNDVMSTVYEGDKPKLLKQINATLRDGSPVRCVFRVCRPDGGGYRWLNLRGNILERRGDVCNLSAVFTDVTERQEMMERLRVREAEYRLAVEGSGRLIYRYNHSDNSVDLTDNVAPIFGLPTHLTHIPDSLFANGSVAKESVAAYRQFFSAIRRGDKTGSMTIQRKTADGNWRWFSGYFSNVFDDSDHPISAIVVFYDVTEQREKEAVYKRWQQSIAQRSPEGYAFLRWNLSQDAPIGSIEGLLLDFAIEPNQRMNACTLRYAALHVDPADRERYTAFVNANNMLAAYHRGTRTDALEYREALPGGSVRWLRITEELVEYADSSDICAYLLFENVDESKRMELHTKELAELDPLTSVLNRMTFISEVEKAGLSPNCQASYALMILDIDGFKLLNDTFGHAAGDQALIDTAAAIRSVLRADDLLGRLGGDEFLICLKNMANDEAIANKAKQINALVHKAYNLEVQLTTSIGVAVFPRDGKDFDTLYHKADTALYSVKASGKDSYAFYSPAMKETEASAETAAVPAAPASRTITPKKRRMLIVEDNKIDMAMLVNLFRNDFIIEKACDGAGALVRMRHYTTALSVVLLDLMMPGLSGFEVLKRMRASTEMQGIPVVVVSASNDQDAGLRALREGAVDYVAKPVNPDIIRIRVESAISKAENQHLRAQNSLLTMQTNEVRKYRAVLESVGVITVECDWKSGVFIYDPDISQALAGTFDRRRLWHIFLADGVADGRDVQAMQELTFKIANDRQRTEGSLRVKLKTPDGDKRWFKMAVIKLADAYQLTDKLILTFTPLAEGVG